TACPANCSSGSTSSVPSLPVMSPTDPLATGGGAPLAAAVALACAAGFAGRTVVLVEGASDAAAVEALADRAGRDLDAERIMVVPTGGSKSFGPFVRAFGPGG